MRPLLETEKNFLKCAVLMIIVGIGLIALSEKTLGIISIIIGVIFAIIAAVSVVKNKDKEE